MFLTVHHLSQTLEQSFTLLNGGTLRYCSTGIEEIDCGRGQRVNGCVIIKLCCPLGSIYSAVLVAFHVVHLTFSFCC